MQGLLTLVLSVLPAALAIPQPNGLRGSSSANTWTDWSPSSTKVSGPTAAHPFSFPSAVSTKGCSTSTHVFGHTTSKLHCVTKYGTTSVQVLSTSTVTDIQPVTQTVLASVTTTVVSTVTPAPITSTSTTTSTVVSTFTASDITDTFSTTVTNTITTSLTTTIPTTVTQTETVSSTSTWVSHVPTSSGWLPIQDTTGSTWPDKRAVAERKASSNQGWGLSAKKWPTKVVCSQLTTVTHTSVISTTVTLDSTTTLLATSTFGAVTATTLLPATAKATTTVTVTSTVTVGPREIDTTLSFTSTTTTTLLFTSAPVITQTTTTTVPVTATTTTYDACAATNLLSSVQSGGNTYYIDNIYNTGANGGSDYNSASMDSSYDCCVSCMGQAGCEGMGYMSGTCYYFNAASTGGRQSANNGFYHYNTGSSGLTVANGNCGYLYSGGMGY